MAEKLSFAKEKGKDCARAADLTGYKTLALVFKEVIKVKISQVGPNPT